ncbi:hypothetical protein PCC7418_0688 [Halothece sp. PCC 7418]|uniref:hypothetical protein n=1 Tax=Halothece sp. (strain PCC 7418) TaxID=65093 RepID=UPI0002A077CA|nr:hypothetical protein [Halothece sp. PCC 7418]AFZ42909.1 hypothetical protein PCC7418_0688 [Halothece sp. PCC 7418]
METTIQETVSLSDHEWDIAHAIARDLVSEKTDHNEVKKILEYLRKFKSKPKLGESFFQYLKTLAKKADQFGHSKQTPIYYRAIETTCNKHLIDYQDQPQLMLEILGWTTRLMRYYKKTSLEELQAINESKQSERQAEIEQASASLEFKEGQIIEATVVGFNKGNKVTYEITATTQRLAQKEPKKLNYYQKDKKLTWKLLA